MNPLYALALAISVSLLISTVVTLIMTDPLRLILRQLCLSDVSSEFWIPFTTLMLYTAPLLVTTLFESTVTAPDVVTTLRTALASALFGGIVALLVVGYQIARARPLR